jgi:bifunctional non-homologous end joining protein LigD
MAGAEHRSAGQLALPIDPGPSHGRLPARIQPMLPGAGVAPYDDEGVFFEPWWPGARSFAFVEGGRARLQAAQIADPLSTLPELRVIGAQVTEDAVILEGTLLVLDEAGRPDYDLLRARLSGSLVSGDGAFVASDLLWAGGVDLTALPFSDRRARLLTVLHDGDRCVASRGLHGEGVTLAHAVASMGLDAISARRLHGRWRPGPATDDWQRIPVAEQPAPERRPLLVLLQRLPLE